jgi:hypothetical protein
VRETDYALLQLQCSLADLTQKVFDRKNEKYGLSTALGTVRLPECREQRQLSERCESMSSKLFFFNGRR